MTTLETQSISDHPIAQLITELPHVSSKEELLLRIRLARRLLKSCDTGSARTINFDAIGSIGSAICRVEAAIEELLS